MTFAGRRPTEEDGLWWKTTFGGRQTSVEEELWRTLHAALCFASFFWFFNFLIFWFLYFYIFFIFKEPIGPWNSSNTNSNPIWFWDQQIFTLKLILKCFRNIDKVADPILEHSLGLLSNICAVNWLFGEFFNKVCWYLDTGIGCKNTTTWGSLHFY